MVLQVSTADIVVIWKFEKKKQIKFHYLPGIGKSFFFSVIGGFANLRG